MKYYRYAKCMGGGQFPHLDLLIGASNGIPSPDTSRQGVESDEGIYGTCRYHMRPGRISLRTHSRQKQRSEGAKLPMCGQQMPG